MNLNTPMNTAIHASSIKSLKPKRPSRPLSAYNLFFQVERQRIIEGTDHLPLVVTPEEVRTIINKHKAKGKRIHRKTHGKIGFQELNATIAERWKCLNKEARRVLEGEARIEKEAHIRKVQQWEETCKAREDAHRMNYIAQQSNNMALFPQALQAQQFRGHQQQQESMDYALRRLRSQIDALVENNNNAHNNQNVPIMEPVTLNQNNHSALTEEQELLRELFQESGLIGDQQNHRHEQTQTSAVPRQIVYNKQPEPVPQWTYPSTQTHMLKQHAAKPAAVSPQPHMLDAMAPEEMDLLFSDF